MIQVQAPSRLHFGLLKVPPAALEATHGRCFGGVGLMVEAPGVGLLAGPAVDWSAEGPLASRALACARRVAPVTPHHLVVTHNAPEHVGLGTGTQLALAAGRAVAPQLAVGELACRLGRGQRSALGIHGFASGGFLVDGGRGPAKQVAPLVARADFPTDWPVLLIVPPWGEGLHGPAEVQAFQRLSHGTVADRRSEALCRLVLLGLLPALAERDHASFSESLYEFNRVAGEAFAPVQGGSYAGPRVAALVGYLRGLGCVATGQSSWGPSVFAIARDADQTAFLDRQVRAHFGFAESDVRVTAANNRGATISPAREGGPAQAHKA